MTRKLKNTLILLATFILIAGIGAVYSYIVQKNKIHKASKQLEEFQKTEYDTKALNATLQEMIKKASSLDSILAKRKYNIPKLINQTKFYDFVNRIAVNFSELTHVNIEYADRKMEKGFKCFNYNVNGVGEYNDVYRLIYAIEQSKELKKIQTGKVSSNITVDENGTPHYTVDFKLLVSVFFADDDRFASVAEFVENDLECGHLYDVFYPLIRNELPPNREGLLDLQGARLLALIPDGAFIADNKGNTFMLWEGDEVYLGYLTKINYETNTVAFVLNKGGIIEKVQLQLEKEEKAREKKK
jgi:Tfp pilus assembly protein PilO